MSDSLAQIRVLLGEIFTGHLADDELFRLAENAERLDAMVQRLRSWGMLSPLVHEVYNPAEVVRHMADARLRAAGFDPDEFRWVGDPTPPPFDPKNPQVVVALYDTLGSLEETAAFYWRWVKENDSRSMVIEPYFHLDTLVDVRDSLQKTWGSRTRRWVTIDLAANQGKNVQWVRKNRPLAQLAGLEVLAAVAQHPCLPEHQYFSNGKVATRAHSDQFASLTLTVFDVKNGESVPRVRIGSGGRDIRFLYCGHFRAPSHWTFPELLT